MWIDAGNQEVFIYVEDKQKNIVEERYRFFCARRSRDGLSNRMPRAFPFAQKWQAI